MPFIQKFEEVRSAGASAKRRSGANQLRCARAEADAAFTRVERGAKKSIVGSPGRRSSPIEAEWRSAKFAQAEAPRIAARDGSAVYNGPSELPPHSFDASGRKRDDAAWT